MMLRVPFAELWLSRDRVASNSVDLLEMKKNNEVLKLNKIDQDQNGQNRTAGNH